MWKENIILYLSCMDIDYANKKNEPLVITTTNTTNIGKLTNNRRGPSNYLSVMFIKSHIYASTCGSLEKYIKFKDLLKGIQEQFAKSNKSLASTLIIQFSSLGSLELEECVIISCT